MTIIYFKKTIIFITVFLSWFGLACAGLEINEIMYAPQNGADYEWIEIYNNSSNSIDLNKYRFFHGEETSGPISLKVGDSTLLQPSKYAIIAKSLTGGYDWLDFSDMVFSSSMLSLPDSGENTYIAISDSNKVIIDDITYDTSKGGSKESKTSLSKINSDWQSGKPTPGKENESVNGSNEENDNEEDSNNNEDEDNTKTNNTPEVFKISTKIISPKIVTAGIPFSINSLTTSNKGDTYAVGRFVWNFGDGFIKETKDSALFSYLYEYPGDYVLTLAYFDSYFDQVADATNRLIIKVVPSEINISSVGDDRNPYIELENKSSYEIILSKWVITGGVHYFIIPEGTTILPNKKMKLSPKITGFNGEDIKSVIITNPDSGIIATYPATIVKQKIKSSRKIVKNKNENPVLQNEISQGQTNDVELNNSQVINLNDLGASASDSVAKSKQNSILPLIGLFVVIDIGVTSFLLLRKRKKESSDYVEKEIRAEDMKIVE